MATDSSNVHRKILVIGSSGFIGSHLTCQLADQGYDVIGFDFHEPAEAFGISKFIRGDVRNLDDLRAAVQGVDVVILLAAVHFDFGHTDEEYFETNETGMQHVLTALTEANVNRLIFTSSIAVYGDRDDEPDEDTAPSPSTPYGASKLAAEKLVEAWVAEDPAHEVVIVRPCAVYGERNVSNMMNLIRQIHSGFFILFGGGNNFKATAYVGNLVDAIAQQLDHLQPGIRVYNYADKPDLTVRKIVTIIRQSLGMKPGFIKMPIWLGVVAALPFEAVTRLTGKNLPVSVARVKKLAQPTRVSAQRIRDAGFKQRVSSEEGLERMVKHYLSEKS